jgi:hypothetical protein
MPFAERPLALLLLGLSGCFDFSKIEPGASRCPTGLLCESFEDPNEAQAAFLRTGMGEASVSDVRSKRGQRSLRLHTSPNPQGLNGYGVAERSLRTGLTAADDAHVRMFLFLEPAGPLSEALAIFSLSGAGGAYAAVDLRTDLSLYVAVVSDAGQVRSAPAPQSLTTETWTCLELGFKQTTGELSLWVDDKPLVTDVSLQAADVSASVSPLLNPAQQHDLVGYVDELVVDRQRIGCDH